ncbi:MAG: NAD-dependent epimerase/dehydratase family protein [Candidatus Nanopelagicales bacterium]
MKILVTGARGFIGTHATAALVVEGHDVVALDRRADAVAAPVDIIDATEAAQVLVCDLSDQFALDRALIGVEAVVHQAAKVGLGDGVLDAADYARDNDLATAYLLAAMGRAAVPVLVLAGSMVVYGAGVGRCPAHGEVTVEPRTAEALCAGDFAAHCRCGATLDRVLVDEECVPRPMNVYAATKLAQEHLVSAWARQTGGTAVSLRYHNVYGVGMPRDTPYAGVAAIFTSSLLRGEAPQVFEDGGQLRDFVHVRDVARANLAALHLRRPGQLTVCNVGSGRARSVLDMALALARGLDGPAPVVTGHYRLGDVRHITASSQKAAEVLDWHASEEFDERVAELADAHRPTGG